MKNSKLKPDPLIPTGAANPLVCPISFDEANQLGLVELGDGDPNRGINLLLTTCCTLAALAPSGSGLRSFRQYARGEVEPCYDHLSVAGNFLILDKYTSDIFREDILHPVRTAQNQIIVKKLDADILTSKGADGIANLKREPTGLFPYDSESSDLERCTIGVAGIVSDPRDLVGLSKRLHVGASLRYPAFFAEGENVDNMLKILPLAQGGKILLAPSISDTSQFSKLPALARTIRLGSTLSGPYPICVKGVFMGTCPPDLAPLLMGLDTNGIPWSDDLLWVTGDGFREAGESKKEIKKIGLMAAYHIAVTDVIVRRWLEPNPVLYDCNYAEFQRTYVKTLDAMDTAGSQKAIAYRLLACTLLFGVLTLEKTGIIDPAVVRRLHTRVAAIAFWLVERSLKAMAEVTGREDKFRVRDLARNILGKLLAEPGSSREIQRRFHKIGSDRCLEALAFLRDAEIIKLERRTWSVTVEREEAYLKIDQLL